MNNDEIEKKLSGIFKDVLDNDTINISRDTTASDIEEWDSLAHISLLVAIENEFKIKLVLNEIKTLHNVGDMIDLIKQKT